MKEENKKLQNIKFNEDEEKLFKKYLEEYNDTFPKILLLNPFEFFQNIIKGLELTLKEKINGFSSSLKSKIEDYLIEKIYPSDYKFALFIKKNIKNRSKEEISSHYFKGEILSHCENDKNDEYYVHTCGEKFQFFKYKTSNNNLFNSKYLFENNSCENNSDKKNSQNDICLFCEKCEMIYKSNFIRFKCCLTGEDFYSKIIDNDNSNLQPLATWKNYHCNAVINDKMKCQKCNEDLYFLSCKKVLCKSCNKELNPLDIKYKCVVCKEQFSSEAKVFNPLEYKALKICIKETIILKIKAKPKNIGCGCQLDKNKTKFIHRLYCKGELFLGELNSKKVVVCNKCDSLGLYDNYTWTCPICFKRFKDNKNNEIINNIKENDEKENKELNISPIKQNKNNKLNNDVKLILFKNNNKKDKNYNENNKENIDLNYEIKENDNYTNKKKRKIPLISSKLDNYTPAIVNKFESRFINKIPRGNSNIYKINKVDTKDENIEVKNLENLFQESINKIEKKSPKKKKNRNISDLIITRNLNKMHKAISSRDIRNKMEGNVLYTDYAVDKIMNNLVEKSDNNSKEKSSKDNISSKEDNSNSRNDNSVNKYNAGPMKRIFKKIKYNSSVNKECGESELIRIIRNIRQHQEIIKSRKKSVNNSGKERVESTDKEQSQIKKKLSKYYKKREINKNYLEKEKNKKDMLKDFDVSDYKIIKQIGQGSFGQIFMVEDKQKNKYALKKIIAISENDIKGLKQEYQILFDIQSNLNESESKNKINIVNIYGLSTKQLDPTTYAMYVLMELGNIDWEKEILERQKQKQYYTEKELMDILYVLTSTLEKLQKENISHRDIKPQNILVFKNNNNQSYKLADFGEAKELISGNRPTEKQTLRGTELYMSPLLFYGLRSRKIKKYIKHNPYKSDVFSLGLCILLAATLCFESLYDVRELKNNVSMKIIIEKYLKKRYSYKIISIICSMLDINETTRDDFVELKKRIDNM